MRTILIITLVSLSTACAGTIQFASISEAYKAYDNGNYNKVLVLISRAENAKTMSAEQKAEITYLKAQTLESLGETQKATTLFEYVQEQHPTSQYAYLARNKLNATRQID